MFDEEIGGLATIAIAAGLGAIIGIEREMADKPAGLRTHMFVAAAAALLMLLSNSVLDHFQRLEGAASASLTSDPVRVIQAIVVGISFLGAGTIIHRDDSSVEGLTTASSILLTAGIGIATAIGKVVLAGGVAVFALVVLLVAGWVERKISGAYAAGGSSQQGSDSK